MYTTYDYSIIKGKKNLIKTNVQKFLVVFILLKNAELKEQKKLKELTFLCIIIISLESVNTYTLKKIL